MDAIKVKATEETLPVFVGGEEHSLRVDLSEDVIQWAAEMAQEWMLQAQRINDAEDKHGSMKDLALLIQPLLWKTVGEDAYEALLRSYGKGKRVPPAKANNLMVPIWAAIVMEVGARASAIKDDPAIKYLADLQR